MKKCEYTEPEVEIIVLGGDIVTLSKWECDGDAAGGGGGIIECPEDDDWGGT